MRYKPLPLTREEIKEIADFAELRRVWGVNRRQMIRILESSPAAKFINDEPWAVEIFSLLPEGSDSYVPPYKIARGEDGKLRMLN